MKIALRIETATIADKAGRSIYRYSQDMKLVLENVEESMPVILHPPPMTDEEFYDFCQQYDGFRVERMADGSVVIMPPTGLESGFQNSALSAQLAVWTKQDKRGASFDSNTEFILPDGSALAPDAAWASFEKINRLSKAQKRKFPRLCPEFVIELMSPIDRLRDAKAKMQRWIDNGVELGWLIDPDRRQVFIYRPNSEAETVENLNQVSGEGPVAGFVLDLGDIWAGL